jgi:hypothetical protein
MNASAEKTTVTETGLVKIGRSGTKTHVATLRYEITDAGTPRQRKRLVSCMTRCQTDNLPAKPRLAVHVLHGYSTDQATCLWCKGRDTAGSGPQ